jgi:hypothetical protein
MSANVEAMVIEKIRKVLIADATIQGYVSDRVYGSHISTVDRPVYPAISLYLMPGGARKNVPAMVDTNVQVDLWLPVKTYTIDDVMTCYQRVRELLHEQALSDTTIGVKIFNIAESGVGPIMFDEDANCHHLPSRYAVVAV